MRLSMLAASTLGLLTPVTAAYATDYLTPAQAQRLMFPQADQFMAQTLTLNASQQQALLKLSGLPARPLQWQIVQARHDGQLQGYVVIDNVIGKFDRITYAVALSPEGRVLQVEVLSYRESHGYEIRLPAWRQQFVGKSVQSALRVGSDIANISGATLSCNHVTDGVRRIVALLRVALDSHLLS